MNRTELLDKSIKKIGEFNRFGSKPGLERVSELLRRLDNPHKNLKVIHVGGTNGKGSVCRYVYSVLQESGCKTGLFISPYIENFTERIEFDGKEISPENLYEITEIVLQKVKDMVSEGMESPTEFEVLTAIALYYFNIKKAEIVILEVGLGGKGDSTNVIEKPLACCIASVSFDHMNVLGNTLTEIAGEKAGIIKKGCPIVFICDDKAAGDVIRRKASELNSPVIDCTDRHFDIVSEQMEKTFFSTEIAGEKLDNIAVSMPGRHQLRNAICALELIYIIKKKLSIDISASNIKTGMIKAVQPGRIEIISHNPLIIVDGSHNYDSVKALQDWIKRAFSNDDRLLILTGVLKDKQYDKMAQILCDTGADFIVTQPDNPRHLPAEEYGNAIKKIAGDERVLEIVTNPEIAIRTAISKYFNLTNEKYKENNNFQYKALIFSGSLYMIGIIKKIIKGLKMEVS